MKKIFTLCFSVLLIFGSLRSNAATFMVEVEDFEFSPAAITVNVGDTIVWMWEEGSHTTTSTLIPVGAIPWDAAMTVNSPVFIYTPQVAGSYDYVCSPHASMGMTGHFTVLGTSSITEGSLSQTALKNVFSKNNELLVSYELPNPSLVSVSLYDAIGNTVSVLLSNARQPSGSYEEKFSLPSLQSGIYILQLRTADANLSRRILVH